MLPRTLQSRATVFGFLSLVAALGSGCSSGDSGSGVKPIRCSVPGAAFCVTSCNLGCTSVGCSITDIAQNQPVTLEFSKDVDPSSINPASFSLKTITGQAPAGRILVAGRWVTFDPEIKITGSTTSFGFRANDTYILTLVGGPNETQSLRSTSGDALGATLTCTLNVTRGVVDLDGQPPAGTIVLPATTSNVSSTPTIVVQFSEIIDPSPFQGATTATSPIKYRVRPTRPASGGGVECNPLLPAVDLGGSPQAITDPIGKKTQVVLKPALVLPNLACVEVEITSDVRDLSGKPATGATFTFTTAAGSTSEVPLIENFANAAQLDARYSSGSWSNGATPGQIGGDGGHGDFDVTDGTLVGGVYEWNTDNQTIPAIRTLSGQNETVTDGVFRFSRFVLPAGLTMRWIGSKPARVFVRGEVDIAGTIEANGGSFTVEYSGEINALGQAGAFGGAGGGRGGKGANQGNGVANQTLFDGQNGEDVRLVAGHAYAAQAVGTGGKGAKQYPTSGANSAVTFNGKTGFSAQVTAGGGGGGFAQAGTAGRVVRTNNNTGEHGPPGAGGKQFNLSALVPFGPSTQDHFLVGGSGGGGGGSHPFFSVVGFYYWRSGAGGAGGGGAIGIRAGGNLLVRGSALLQATGGSGFVGTTYLTQPPGPGGGGSGGSAVLQAGGDADVLGSIDVDGGTGGGWNEASYFELEHYGGDGSPGFVRVEQSGGLPNVGGAVSGSLSTGTLSDQDQVVGCQSKLYNTRQIFSPLYLRYEIQATEDGTNVFYSDDPTWAGPSGFQNAGIASGSTPIRLFVEGATVQPATGQILSTTNKWRVFVAPQPGPDDDLNDDLANAYRFALLFDRTLKSNITVKKLTVFYRS